MALPGVKFCVLPLAEAGWFSARFVFAVTPVPDSETVAGLPGALLAMLSVPVREPVAVGVKVTLTVQDAPAARVVPQLLVCAKSPVAENEETDAAVPPVLLTVTACEPLVEPTVWLPKDTLDGFAETDGPEVPPPLGKTSKSES